jgi:predicted Zn-dependent protease
LREFIAKSPNDPFPRYGLAIELKNSGQLDAAASAFAELMQLFPDYTAAYLHAGGVLVGLKRREEAARIYRAGIDASTRKRDLHAKGELEAALAELEGSSD